jgi:hypothetical protein
VERDRNKILFARTYLIDYWYRGHCEPGYGELIYRAEDVLGISTRNAANRRSGLLPDGSFRRQHASSLLGGTKRIHETPKRNLEWVKRRVDLCLDNHTNSCNKFAGVLASSPIEFINSRGIVRARWPLDLEGRPYSITNIGLSMELFLDRNPSQKDLDPRELIAPLTAGEAMAVLLLESP